MPILRQAVYKVKLFRLIVLKRTSDVKILSLLCYPNQVTTFLNRLSGPSIGVTALGMFVVNKPMILTISHIQQATNWCDMELYAHEIDQTA